MASASPSNSYYQSQVYPLVADFLDDYEYSQDNTSGSQRVNAKQSASPNSSSGNLTGNNNVAVDLLDGDDDRYLTQQQQRNSYDNSYSHSASTSVRQSSSEPSMYAQNDVVAVAVAQPVTFQDHSNQTQLIYASNDQYRYDPYKTTSTALTTYSKERLPPKVQRFKQKRKVRTAVSTVGGVAVGGLVAGPFGMVVGGYGAYAISKTVGKHRERKLLEKCLNDEAGVKGSNWETISRAVVS